MTFLMAAMFIKASEFVPDLPHEVAHDWYGLGTWWPLLAVIAFGIWAYWDRKTIRERLKHLESDVAELKGKLSAKEKLYGAALRHLRDLWEWIHGDRAGNPPEVPTELIDEL